MRRFLSAAIFVSAIVVASAQMRFQQGSRFNSSLVEIGTSYLMAPSVQKELKLSPAISQKVSTIFVSSFKGNDMSSVKDPQAQRKIIQDRMAEVRKKQAEIAKELTPAQKSRLKQIVLQQMGASGMLHPEAKSALKLTPDEERKINAIIRDGNEMMRSSMSPPKGQRNQTDFRQQIKQMQSKMSEWRTKMTTLALKELTPAQRNQWKAMCGKPFTLDFSGMGFGGPKVNKGRG